MADQALDGLKVLDLGWHIAGPYCTKLLADYGAEVIKVERPDGGDPTRKAGPFPNDKPDPEASGFFFYLNNNKKSITLDLKADSGKRDLKELIKWADILVENFSPRVMPNLGLDYDTIKSINPGLVATSISNFGLTGPYRDYKATDIVVQALGGWLFYRGDPRREPLMAASGLRISEFIGGMYGAAATMSGLIHKRQTGIGQHVDVSIMEAVIQMSPQLWAGIGFPASFFPPTRVIYTPGIEECKNGYVGLNILTGQHWVDLCGLTEMYDWVEDENYALMGKRAMRAQEVKDRLQPWLMARTRQEILEEGIAWRVPVSKVYTSEDVVKSEVHQQRGYLAEVEHPVMGKMTMPGPFCRMSETPWQIKSPAPLLGQHNKEVFDRLGIGKKEGPETESGGHNIEDKSIGRSATEKQPFAGIRVFDLSRFWSGPCCTSYLGGLGAEVIKVEAIQSVDGFRWPQKVGDKWWEASGNWCPVNLNKYDVTLDMNQPRGMELAKELIKKSDVVIDNFPSRVMENFNLTYPVVKELREDIIMVSMPGYGMTGPWRDYPGFGFAFEQSSGLAYLTGYADGGPLIVGGAADPIVGTHTAFAIQAALEYRRRTGKGQFIEISQLEALTSFMGPAVMDYVMNERVWGRRGNYSPVMAPHNIYRCKGNETWVVIAVQSEEEWQAFCKVTGNPEWAKEERFAAFESRVANQGELDSLIGDWTIEHDPYEVMDILQKAGVPAGAVTDSKMLLEEPHLNERGFWVEMDRVVVGKQRYSTFPIKFSETPIGYRPAPTLGEHNEYVLGSILGLTKDQIEKLEKEQIIGTEPLQTGLGL
jgi:crotonobetainyl-CoA:carnitine CoA-transferase CaiB-like acyl-CoA transferase